MDQETLAEASISPEYISIHSEEDQPHLQSKDRDQIGMSDIPKTRTKKKSALKKVSREEDERRQRDASNQQMINNWSESRKPTSSYGAISEGDGVN